MKIAIMSDLHLEYEQEWSEGPAPELTGVQPFNSPDLDADILVLAGDVHTGSRAFDWAHESFNIPTILISGNHEVFGYDLFRMIALNRYKSLESDHRTVYLERSSHEVISSLGKRVRFIGATLWTNFSLYDSRNESMNIANEYVEDFKRIKIERGHKFRALKPLDTVRLHEESLEFLKSELNLPYDGITVVITHHAPSPRSIAPRFIGSPLNPAFVSNLEDLIWRHQPELWIHGHVHDSFDYYIGNTRIICNPRGYFPHELNPIFNPQLVIEI